MAKLTPAQRQARYRERHPERQYHVKYPARNRVRSKRQYAENREHYNDVRRAYRARVRANVLEKYGSKCACCEESEPKFLAIDHIHGDGKKDRAEAGVGYAFYLKLFKGPLRLDRYRVLCHNCNMAFGFYGSCPHQKRNPVPR